MNMIDLIYVKYSSKWCCALEYQTRCHLRPPSVQAESCCVHPSTRISLGATILSSSKSNSPAILVKPSKPPFKT
ncbi:uncharacterized protein N7487_006858 [Penicillium crustosum]|uniref:uncharacterized protein n=1 Tax=Penicillium crustosum TaxID=36656 RepID=UPI0023A50A29|nr:uncharacterized protein N7487_006858 [Penicillium crustosum]KAJ5412499.1 hypothetical protein N7487_006858 [Penicillium crustosum]